MSPEETAHALPRLTDEQVRRIAALLSLVNQAGAGVTA